MLEYLAAIIAFFSIYRGMTIIMKKHMDYNPKKFMREARPIYLKMGKNGVLLIHGFTSSPHELRDLAKYFAKKGLTVYAPLLKGHGTSPENLATTNDEDWIKSAEEGLTKLNKECKQVFIVGNSLGGNIAMCLAAKHKIRGLVLLAPPLIFKKERLFKAIYHIIRLMKDFQKKWKHKTMKNLKPRKGHYEKIPLNTLKYVTKTVRNSKLALSRITVPTLLMQSTNDVWSDERSVNYVVKNIRSKDMKVVWINDVYHVFIMEKDNKNYIQYIYRFINENMKKR